MTFARTLLTIVSVLFFGWISLLIGAIEDNPINEVSLLSNLQCGMLVTILIYIVSDRIKRDKAEEKEKKQQKEKEEKTEKEKDEIKEEE